MDSATYRERSSPRLVSILVVDTDDDTRALYRQSFALAGCEVVDACDGREALTKALVDPPTLVVTETTLPFLDGYALCEILRRDRMTAQIPILVVTADARPTHIDRARRVGADAVLVKPASIDAVMAEIQRLVAEPRGGDSSFTQARARNAPAESLPNATSTRRTPRSKLLSRFTTTTPPATPPRLVCPSCDAPLTYEYSYVGGVNDANGEQWDHYACGVSCGTFAYRHRTRKLSRMR
jgi:CheY-like chemotaxis protein